MALLDTAVGWLILAVTACVLLFVWAVYMGRGRRATKITFSGFGVSLTIDSNDSDKRSNEKEDRGQRR